MDILIMMNRAISKTGALALNAEFVLKDLFDGVEWGSLSKGDRLSFGKHFKNEVREGNVPNVVYIGKAPNNSAVYKKEP